MEIAPEALFARTLVPAVTAVSHQSAGALLQFTDKGVFGNIPKLPVFAELSALPEPDDRWPRHVTDGLLFTAGDDKTLVACCEYVLAEGGSAYLYVQGSDITVHLWESTFLELWCASREAEQSITAALINDGARLKYELEG